PRRLPGRHRGRVTALWWAGTGLARRPVDAHGRRCGGGRAETDVPLHGAPELHEVGVSAGRGERENGGRRGVYGHAARHEVREHSERDRQTLGAGAPALVSRSSHRHDRTWTAIVVVERGRSRGVGEPARPVHEKRVAITTGRERHHGRPHRAARGRESHRSPRGVPVVEIADQRYGGGVWGDEDELKFMDGWGRAPSERGKQER